MSNIKIALVIVSLVFWAAPSQAQGIPSSEARKTPEFRLPPATPVTCRQPERGKIVQQIKDYASNFGESWDHHSDYKDVYDKWWNELYNNCDKICHLMHPVIPGRSWNYAGQHGYNKCEDTWLKLVGKQGDRIFVDNFNTFRHGEPRQIPSESLFTKTMRCSTRDLWTGSVWSPIVPNSLADVAVSKFC